MELQVYPRAYFIPLVAGIRSFCGQGHPQERIESSPSGICAWLGLCTGQSFSLCAVGVSTPYPKPTTLPEGSPADPFLLVPLSALLLQLLTLARAKTGLGKAGLARPFTSTALELCHWPAVATSLAPPVPRAMSAVLG